MLLTITTEVWAVDTVSNIPRGIQKGREQVFINFNFTDTAYAQNLYNKEWYNFDDSHVNKVTTKDIKVSFKDILQVNVLTSTST